MTISTALDKLDLNPYNLMRRCKRIITLQCFSFKKLFKLRKRTTKAKHSFQYCRNIFGSSIKRWIRPREKGFSENSHTLYILQKYSRTLTAITTEVWLLYHSRQPQIIIYNTLRNQRIRFYSGGACLVPWNLSDYLIILSYDTLEQDLILFYNCRII